MLEKLYWTWYWNPELVTLGFLAIALPTSALIAFAVMVWDMITYKKNPEILVLPPLESNLENTVDNEA